MNIVLSTKSHHDVVKLIDIGIKIIEDVRTRNANEHLVACWLILDL